MLAHLEIGKQGEKAAAKYLKSLGYKILEKNVRLGKDEIDIIAYDRRDKVIVFAEVKSRAKFDEDFRPELNAGWWKKEKLKRSARAWVTAHEYEGGYRIDLVCVAGGKVVNHMRELSWT